MWLLFAALVPVLLTGLPDVVGVAIGLLVLAAGSWPFFPSLAGLHRQMVAAKEGELAVARDLYARAYEPVSHGADPFTNGRSTKGPSRA